MQKLISVVKKYGVFGLTLALPALASAQLHSPGGITPPTNTVTVSTITQSICNVIGWVFFGFVVLSVIMVLVAAFKYLTAAGDPEKVKSASHTLLYAAVAIVVALLARALPGLVGSVTGLTNTTGFNTC